MKFLTRDIDTGKLTEILALSNMDAFGRQRVSNPETLFDLTHIFDKQSIYVQENVTSGGTGTHLPNESSVMMAVTTTVGSRVLRQTKRYFSYQPGKSMLLFFTGVLTENVNPGIRSRIGLFDDGADKTVDTGGNGIFFEYSNGTFKIVKRTFITGSQVDTAVEAADWSEGDQLDGSGASGITLDVTKAEIFWVDLEWLGVGTVRCGIVYNGEIIHLHSFHHANLINSVYMTRASLPIRYEITRVSGVIAGRMKQICATVIIEGGYQSTGRVVSRPMVATRNMNTTPIPIMSVRLRSGYNRALINLLGAELMSTSIQSLIYEIVVGGTLTNANFVTQDALTSAAEYDISATGITGGRVVDSGFVSSANRQIQSDTGDLDAISSNIEGVSEIISLVVRATGGAATYAAMTWREFL